MTEPSYDHRISIAQEYFRRADAGRAEDQPRFLWGLDGRTW